MRQNIVHEVNAAAPPGSGKHLGDGGLEAFMSIGHDQLHAAQASARQLAQELGPDRLRLGRADLHAQHLAPAIAVDADRDDHRD